MCSQEFHPVKGLVPSNNGLVIEKEGMSSCRLDHFGETGLLENQVAPLSVSASKS